MDVAQLISKLEELPASTPVIIATDAEGNGFAKLAAIEPSMVVLDVPRIEPEHVKPNEEDFDFCDAQPCVVLWPA